MDITPKEKAIELVDTMYVIIKFYIPAKQCTLIAIDEVIKALEEHQWQNRHTIENYKQIKLEVEKL
jgi:hypothetical protein